MTKKTVGSILIAVCVLGLAGCKSKKPAAAEAEKDWYRYISAFTSGTMSRKSPVRVLFVDNAGTPGPAAAGLFEFSPSIDGAAEWTSPRELVFKPKGELKPGQEYRAVLRVGKILDLPKAYARFEFRFGVVRPDMEVTIEGLFAEDPERPQAQVLRGRVVTADMEEKALVEKVIEAEQDGQVLPVEWSHAQEGLTHYFTVKEVVRKEGASAVNLSWDGAPIRIDNRGRRDVEVPAMGDFTVVSVEPVLGETRHVLVRFSDVLAKDQKLQGLIDIGDRPLTFEIEGNVVRVYSTQEFLGDVAVRSCPASATTWTAA